MKYAKTLGLGLLVVALAAGCGEPAKSGGKKDAPAKVVSKQDSHTHEKGPNGGVVFDLGKHHGEFTVDREKKECTILVLGEDEKTPTPVAAKELTLTTKEAKTRDGKAVAAMTIKMVPKDEKDGKATKFGGSDPGLGHVVDFEGTVVGEIDGKPAQGTFK